VVWHWYWIVRQITEDIYCHSLIIQARKDEDIGIAYSPQPNWVRLFTAVQVNMMTVTINCRNTKNLVYYHPFDHYARE
jgi:hypothetical protein